MQLFPREPSSSPFGGILITSERGLAQIDCTATGIRQIVYERNLN
jgi:hypothetical protein